MIRRRQRKAMSQINVVPYIDVMLVLLVIFMVTAPMISPNQVELPSVGKSSQAPASPLEVMIREDGVLLLRDTTVSAEGEALDEGALRAAIQSRLTAEPARPVVISADKSVRYESVMRVMSLLQKLGARNVGLLVKPEQ